ncbi:MAG: glutamate ABC transporter substrate-binding protein [Streptomycetaceae bacterium]|nr:glutamate ABC transporter substrate-binding protein [Streptomycetaceae bacterium]
MQLRTTGPRLAAVAAAVAVCLLGTASSRGADGPARTAPVAAAPAAPAEDTACDTVSSLRPAKNANGAKIQEIRQRGTLRVGVDQNSFNWGYRDPASGQIRGFDIDLARAIAASILGDAPKISFIAVPTAKRIEAVKSGQVDMVVRTMTITCERMKEVAFSKPYFRVSQSLVVPRSVPDMTVAEGVRGKRVCAADESGSERELESGRYAPAEVKIVENQLDCLVLMQLGRIDATLADTTLAYAQQAQDPMVRVLDERIVPAFMGVAISQSAPDLVAWVNQVLAEYTAGDGWRNSYEAWLAPSMGTPEKYLP